MKNKYNYENLFVTKKDVEEQLKLPKGLFKEINDAVTS